MKFAPLNPAGYVLGTGKATRVQVGNRGWDVYALQKGLLAFGYALPAYGADGGYGEETSKAVATFQKAQGLFIDGWGGPSTQQRLMTLFINRLPILPASGGLPDRLARTQLGKESGLLPGNHSPARKETNQAETHRPDANGNYFDVGGGQMATEWNTYEDGYDPKIAVASYLKRIRGKYDEYKRVDRFSSERRLWELAAGSWNAPSWTDRLARGQSLSATNREWIEDYIARMCVGMVV